MSNADDFMTSALVKKLAIARSEYKTIVKFKKEYSSDGDIFFMANRIEEEFKEAYVDADAALVKHLQAIYDRNWR